MSQIVGVWLGTEVQATLDALGEGTQQRKRDVLRESLQVVDVEQLRQASQESRPERAECELS